MLEERCLADSWLSMQHQDPTAPTKRRASEPCEYFYLRFLPKSFCRGDIATTPGDGTRPIGPDYGIGATILLAGRTD